MVASTIVQGSPHHDVNETNMQFESVGCFVSNTSCDGEVPDEMESPCKKTQVSVTSLDITTNSSETNMQLESAGYMLSNTSCDGEVPDEMESPSKKQTQVSITSLDVATNPSESTMQLESDTSCDGGVVDEMESPCKKKTHVSITSLDVATNPLETQMSMFEVSLQKKRSSTTSKTLRDLFVSVDSVVFIPSTKHIFSMDNL